MTIWWLVLILASIGSAGIAFIWLAVRINGAKDVKSAGHTLSESYEAAAKEDVEHLFNEEFREELRNRGRLNFEKIINENAMFLQQDLRLTTSQINDYMKNEITAKLKEEFAKYEQSIMDATQIAVESIQKTNTAVDEQRRLLSQQVQQEILAEKQETIRRFESNMADIVNHYVLAAIGNQIDLNDQLEYILGEMEANKKAIIEDVHGGA
ncbi:MAG TPA: hypothetical protein VFX84_00510 [Candidatus Saccharimonadales bacterium]|nr:hypothetical protein [Candidatus Saccharimonadales bacterium]